MKLMRRKGVGNGIRYRRVLQASRNGIPDRRVLQASAVGQARTLLVVFVPAVQCRCGPMTLAQLRCAGYSTKVEHSFQGPHFHFSRNARG